MVKKAQHFLIAPDSFKGSLSAIEFCEIAKREISQSVPEATIWSFPLSDGGEGFIDSIVYAGLAVPISVSTLDPLHRPIQSQFAWDAQNRTAYIEMAQASGLTLLSPNERNPLQTSSYGTGLIIQQALNQGAQKIVIGLGGSATNDGGAGALQALDIPFYDQSGHVIDFRQTGAMGLAQLARIGSVPEPLKSIEWCLAADVTNPLLGENGATAVFSPQKGATEAQMQQLEAGLAHFAEKMAQAFDTSIANRPGAGAAGGFAGGFIGILQAHLQPGFELLKEALKLPQLLQDQSIDYVITGEGKIDAQTLMGKLPYRLAEWVKSQQQHAPYCVGLCGRLEVEQLPYFDGLHSIHSNEMQPADWDMLVAQTHNHLSQTLRQLLNSWV